MEEKKLSGPSRRGKQSAGVYEGQVWIFDASFFRLTQGMVP